MLTVCSAFAAITITGPTTVWTPVQYPGTTSDFIADEQANSVDRDIVGDASHPGFYTQFDNAGTSQNKIDGEVAFRLRLAGNKPPPQFGGQAWVGADVDGNGSIDIFIGASASTLSINDAGTGLNTSPSTTTINSTPVWSTAVTATNYSWTPVTLTNNPGATDLDLDNKGDNDYFLSFAIPFSQFVNAVIAVTGVTGFDDTAPLAYVAATASQGNKLNSDLNGVNGGDLNNDPTSWTALGALSPKVTITGELYNVPEPSAAVLAAGLAGLCLVFLRRRSA